MDKEKKPNCYKCKNRRSLPGDCHSGCANKQAKVTARKAGIDNGWFHWPWNFDPCWLLTCDSFDEIN